MPSMLTGSKNPNYGKTWDAKQRANLSNKVKERFKDPAERFAAGNSNRGKKFSKERIAKMHAHRSSNSYTRIPTEERKIAIGIQSVKNWTNEQFRRRVISGGIKTKECNGLIVPRALLTEWQIYWRLANWMSSYNYAPGIELGKNGLCRDHMVSRKQGFENGVFPEILRHPTNCEIISISENSKRARLRSYQFTINGLCDKILKYSGNYPQHHHTVELVTNYLNGERWIKEDLV